MDHTPSGRRPHYHRGRRGTDRRGNERRAPQATEGARGASEQIDVDQILREIRTRISRQGVDLTPQQIQDLAARRLEAILDPRTVSPTLFDQLRRGAAAAEPLPPVSDASVAVDEETLFQRGGVAARFMRWLLGPLLKPLLESLHAQARINRESATRAAELERRQTEWNALHYQVLQRLVTEVSRNSIEVQSYAGRLESLTARLDFADRRVRALEQTAPQGRGSRPATETAHVPAALPGATAAGGETTAAAGTPLPMPDGPRRRRRRRRGRRSGLAPLEPGQASSAPTETELEDDVDGGDDDEDPGMPASPAGAAPEPSSSADAPPPAPAAESPTPDSAHVLTAPAEPLLRDDSPPETDAGPPESGPQER